MKRFLAFVLIVIVMVVYNQAAFGCCCDYLPQEEVAIEETQIVEETQIEEETQAVEETQIIEETPVVEETQAVEETAVEEECEAFSAECFDHSANYGDYVAFDYVEEVVEETEESATKETQAVEETQIVEETPVVEEEPVIEEGPVQEEAPVVEEVQQVAAVAMKAVEKTVEAAKPVIEKAQTAYVQTGCDKVVNTFIAQLCVMLAAIVALSVLLKYAVKQNK